jgi:UDP-N-acetylglucosamine 2-epimerase
MYKNRVLFFLFFNDFHIFKIPVHPKTLQRLHEFNLYKKLSDSENILMINTVGYFKMLELMKNC